VSERVGEIRAYVSSLFGLREDHAGSHLVCTPLGGVRLSVDACTARHLRTSRAVAGVSGSVRGRTCGCGVAIVAPCIRCPVCEAQRQSERAAHAGAIRRGAERAAAKRRRA
jgi:hypothetical protein